MHSDTSNWKIYRTRFLIKAKQLDAPLVFTDSLGREHSGRKGDYLVESSDGLQRIAPREIFEDIYVPMGPAGNSRPASSNPRSDVASAARDLAPSVRDVHPSNQEIGPSQNRGLHQSLHQPQLNPRRTHANRSFVA